MTRLTDANIEKLFGVSDAENERPERLKEYFFRNKAYENLSNDLPIRVLVGHKGSGKSALLKMLFLEDKDDDLPSIWLQPSDILNTFETKKVSFPTYIESWKNSLLDVISNQIVQELQPDTMREVSGSVVNTTKALLSLVRQKIDKVVAGGSSALQKDVLAKFSNNNFIRVYIDDLDRGWEAKKDDINRISALLNAIRDLCGSDNSVQFRIGLRTDVYYLVRTSDESTDKIEDKVVWLRWSSQDLLLLFAKRIETFYGNSFDEQKSDSFDVLDTFSKVVERRFQGAGKWSNAPIHRVLVSLQRNRPRDLVKLLGSSAKDAYQNNSEIILTRNLQNTFAAYSAERLQDIVNEFGTEMPEVKRVLLAMKPTTKEKSEGKPFLFTQDELDKKLAAVLKQISVKFKNGTIATPRTVGQFLYKIDFIIARKTLNDGAIVRSYFDQSRFLFDQFLDFGFSWEVHPAYRWALQPETVSSLLETIELSPA
jgi:hypothetical protein